MASTQTLNLRVLIKDYNMLVLVPTVKTPIAVPDFTKAFIEAWFNIYGNYPTKQSTAVLYGQWGVETGPKDFCWGNNIGNSKAVDDKNPNTRIKYQMLANTWEIIGGKKYIFQPPSPVTWFRAFDTLSEGMEHHLALLRNKRYKIAWAAVEKGDPVLFAQLLKQQGYYTAPVEDYVRLISYHYNKFMKMTTYETVLKQIQDQKLVVQFPKEYQPTTFDTKDIVVEKPNRPEANSGFANTVSNIFNKIKGIIK